MLRMRRDKGQNSKKAYKHIIITLGGDMSTSKNFDINATHFLSNNLSNINRSYPEKILGSIAARKWFLHLSYLDDSKKEGRFLDEEEYEWGNPKSKGKIPEPKSEIENAIATAAYRWRLKLQSEPDGPFSKIVALLMVSEKKYDQFKTLIEIGGGTVMQTRPPYDAIPSLPFTHCFIDVEEVNQQWQAENAFSSQRVDWATLAGKSIFCLPLQYLRDYLIARKPPNPRDCVLAEFKKYLPLFPE